MQTDLNHDTIEGTPTITQRRRSQIKMSEVPQIAICWPIGAKQQHVVTTCEKEGGGCGRQWSTPGVRMPNLVPVELLLCHMNMLAPLNVSMTYFAMSGKLSAEARQIMTMSAIKAQAKYILYWDDDTLPPPKGLYILHNWMEQHPEAGAISGVYTTREDPPEPLVYREHGAGAAWDFEMGPGAKPEPILGAGAGFLLARTEAIIDVHNRLAEEHGKAIPVWADEKNTSDQPGERGSMWGHDVRFCRLLNEHEWPVYVHGEVLCEHFDMYTGRLFKVPEDAPGFKIRRQKNINTADYWDQVYGEEGADSWRKYPEMFNKVADEIVSGFSSGMENGVVELGCGVGILGSKLTAEGALRYAGYDISPAAVEMCRARFLRADVMDVKDFAAPHICGLDVLVATELMEHLDEDVFNYVVGIWDESGSQKFVFTVPDNCMGPDEVPEHTALFNESEIRTRLGHLWSDDRLEAGMAISIRFEKADERHLMVVLEK